MNSPQSPPPSVNIGSPLLYDRSLNTTDIKGAQPQKPFVRQEIDNRSLITQDIKGAQPKVTIRAINHPHYDPSNQFQGFDSSMFQRPQGVSPSQQFQPQYQQPIQSPIVPSSYYSKPPYQGINSADPEKNSFYNGPTADRQHRPNNQPPSQIVKEHALDTAGYIQNDPVKLPTSPQHNFYLDKYSSPKPQQQQQQIPILRTGYPRPLSNSNIQPRLLSNPNGLVKPLSSQNLSSQPQINYNPQMQYSNIQQNIRSPPSSQIYGKQQENSLGVVNPAWRAYSSQRQEVLPQNDDFIVEEFKNTAVIRPENFDSKEKYQKFKQSIGSRIVSPKHYDIPEKMMQYQKLKDEIYHFQQPKLHLNRENVERQLLSKSAMGGYSSSPNIFRPNISGYQPTPAQLQLAQQLQSPLPSQLLQTTIPQRLISPGIKPSSSQAIQVKSQTPLLSPPQQQQQQQLIIDKPQPASRQGNIISRVPSQRSRPKSHQDFGSQRLQQIVDNNSNYNNQMNGSPLLLGKQLSPKYENIEKNIFSKPLSAERKSPLVSYVKPYHLNPSIDFTTEYITKYNKSPEDQLQKSITPVQKIQTPIKVPWETKKEEYNLIGNYVQDKRSIEKFEGYNLPVDGYYKQYNGPVIDNMRKDIHDTGTVIPYEVKFKYEKTKNNYYKIDSTSPKPKETPLSQTGLSKSFVAGYSDLFRTQHYTIRDPVDPRKFHYSQKASKINKTLQSQ